MILRFRNWFLVLAAVVITAGAVSAQDAAEKKDEKKAEQKTNAKDAIKNPTVDQVVESSIIIYGLGGGREKLNQIRKTALERGKVSVTDAEGKTEQANYARWTQRAESLKKEKVRLDQEFPTARFSLVFNDEKVFGIFNDKAFTPREDASNAFLYQIVHSIDALLRYKENGSKLELAGREKIHGVEYYQVDMTDVDGNQTRFFISVKTYRVMMLDFEANGVKYRRKFYDYNYAQGTLVPYRTVLWAGDKMIEETEVGTITYGQKIEDGMFSAS
ncbi:MAG: hypothetical protein ABI539_15410 [Acidobacteriota bacterium]